MSEIKGKLSKIIFHNNQNGYTVGLLKVKESDIDDLVNKTVTFTGNLPDLNEIDTYIMTGNLTNHEKYGSQFQVKSINRIMPQETDAMIDILSSNLFKGIGKKTAEKLVSVFKEKTFDVILNDTSNLLLIPGISEKQAKTLKEALKQYQGSYEDILMLNKLGFSTSESMKIYHYYKDKLNEVLDGNLYSIYYDIDEISFPRVDSIFVAKYEKDSPSRVAGAIVYIIKTLSMTYGHTYFSKEEVNSYLFRVLKVEVSEKVVADAYNSLLVDERIVIKDDRLYLWEMYEAETLIARRLRLLAHEDKIKYKNLDTKIKEIETHYGIVYTDEQLDAIKLAITRKVAIITGGPGTGKTTILKGILDLYKVLSSSDKIRLNEQIALLAPTGRASKRMSEVTNFEASTIHRFLKWNKDTNRFQINEYNKSSVSFVIIDEASMIDTMLLANLLKGLKSSCHIIFVGDANQLPSVAAGDVLNDMIESKELPVYALKNWHRQGSDSKIIPFAHRINEGILDRELLNSGSDLEFIPCKDNEIIEVIGNVCKDYNSYDLQVLAPIYKNRNGIYAINDHLQKLWNPKSPSKKEIEGNESIYREKDKVIQLSNMKDESVFNGDIGIIDRIKLLGNKELYIDYDGNLVKYTKSMLQNFTLGYAISIHKSQGSEFDTVLIPFTFDYRKMLYRKLIYTGVTRCKKKLILVGDINALEQAIRNNQEQKRRTSLKLFLENGIL
ncbi:MAG: ATP-dependent RecD-like DNA helicase [Bacilli bacterium]|jgi:exodeoxyribonuclease V alpha subunit|nr:ATP-dependent RecD-like DNA helicase [Bacilli bacterium]